MGAMSYVSSYFHCVFRTKEPRPLISPSLRDRLWPLLDGVARNNGMKTIEIGSVRDPVHEEFLSVLRKHHIAFEERCLWE